MEKLSIRIEYDEDKGLSVVDLINQLRNFNDEHAKFVSRKSKLYIENVDKGSVLINFVQHTLSDITPFMNDLILADLYTYGKHIIQSFRIGKKNPSELRDAYENPKIKQNIESAYNLTKDININGDNNSIKFINITATSGNQEPISHTETIEELQSIERNTNALIMQKKEESVILEPTKFESMEFIFNTTSSTNVFKGTIRDLDDKPKKVVFKGDDVKSDFNLENMIHEDVYQHTFIVDVMVHYNKNNSIAKYEILGVF